MKMDHMSFGKNIVESKEETFSRSETGKWRRRKVKSLERDCTGIQMYMENILDE